ncbi:PaaI family thioesterase [Sulfitobacter sabulilitoris]|uniref:PaaI family thioesterase n=1 Tax=Sulfitobacter sabulilitoris TaxID=2562655 RepID=A0A5S3PE85_9RHOB|nr:PaaI family thioesterase [Sulfitobacter sabulilitoris]TMM51269.1 PaaI family thioesterase [Sulfitobacter sabulilitoris]
MPSPQRDDDDSGLIRDETGTQTLIGYVVDVSDPDGSGRCWLDIGPQHTNRHGVLHGGIASAILDNASGTTGSLTVDATGRAPFLTISLTTQFIAPVKQGTRVTATGRVTGGGRSILYISADLVDEDGRLIASSTGVFKRVPQERLT